jgi:hypothetical protein
MRRGVFKHFCGIKRDQPVGTNGRSQKTTISTANRCLILPMPTRKELENGFTIGSGFDCFFPEMDQDVKAGDQIVWNARTYNVRAVHVYEVPRVGHVHCLTTREGV